MASVAISALAVMRPAPKTVLASAETSSIQYADVEPIIKERCSPATQPSPPSKVYGSAAWRSLRYARAG